jgi:hypothetical protein
MVILLASVTSWAQQPAPCQMAPLVMAEPLDSAPDIRCAWADLDFAGRAWARVPDVGISRGVSLQRTRAEVGLRALDVQARFAVLTARSGGESGYVGVEGEAIVPVVQIAEARWDWRELGLAAAAGLVDDPWVMTLQPVWNRVDVLRPLPTDAAFLDRADAGGWLSWTGPEGIVAATVAATTGEGIHRRERNSGTNLTGVLRARPLAMVADPPVQVEIAAFGREGSRGIGQAPDHRAGAAILVRHPYVDGGVDGLMGWGLRGDGALRPAGVSFWATSGSAAPAVAFARLDRRTDHRGVDGAGQGLTLLGAGPRLPFGDQGPGYVIVGWEGRTFGPAARPIAGSEAIAGSDLFFVQLGARLIAAGGW